MELPDINLIHYFIVTAKTHSYSAAARELFISRQALTRSIRRIENMVGGKLFEQEGSHLSLTSLGVQYQQIVLPLVKSWDDYAWKMQHLNTINQSILRIAVSQGVMLSIGTSLPKAFRKKYPSVLLSIEEALPDNVCTMVEEGTVELGIVGTVPSYIKDFAFMKIKETGMWLMMHESHPLAKSEEIHPEDLQNYPITAPGLHNHQYRFFQEQCYKAGIKPNIAALSTYSATVGLDMQDTEMIYFGFPSTVSPSPEGWCVRPFAISGGQNFGTYLISRSSTPLTPSADHLLRFLKDNLGIENDLI